MEAVKTKICITFHDGNQDTIDSLLTVTELFNQIDDYQIFYGFWDVDGSYTMLNSQDIRTIYFEPVQNDTP